MRARSLMPMEFVKSALMALTQRQEEAGVKVAALASLNLVLHPVIAILEMLSKRGVNACLVQRA